MSDKQAAHLSGGGAWKGPPYLKSNQASHTSSMRWVQGMSGWVGACVLAE